MPSIGGEVKIDNNKNLLMKEIDKNVFMRIKRRGRSRKKQTICKVYNV